MILFKASYWTRSTYYDFKSVKSEATLFKDNCQIHKKLDNWKLLSNPIKSINYYSQENCDGIFSSHLYNTVYLGTHKHIVFRKHKPDRRKFKEGFYESATCTFVIASHSSSDLKNAVRSRCSTLSVCLYIRYL